MNSAARLVVTLLLAGLSASAVNADDLLSQINQQLLTDHAVAGEFEQRKFLSVLPQPLISIGSFRVDEDQSLEWHVKSPIKSKFVFSDAEKLNQDGAAVITAMIGRLFRAVINADWVVLDQYFTIEGSIVKGRWQLLLRPKDEVLQQVFEKIELSGDKALRTMMLYEKTGDRTEISFSMIGL